MRWARVQVHHQRRPLRHRGSDRPCGVLRSEDHASDGLCVLQPEVPHRRADQGVHADVVIWISMSSASYSARGHRIDARRVEHTLSSRRHAYGYAAAGQLTACLVLMAAGHTVCVRQDLWRCAQQDSQGRRPRDVQDCRAAAGGQRRKWQCRRRQCCSFLELQRRQQAQQAQPAEQAQQAGSVDGSIISCG